MNLNPSDILYKFHKLLLKGFRTELVGSGSNNHNYQCESLGRCCNRFNQYYDTTINELLTLRLGNLTEIGSGVLALNAEYLYLPYKSLNNVLQLVTKIFEAFTAGYNVVLVPYNLNNQHWVGLVVEDKQGSIILHYQDSLQQLIPSDLLDQFQLSFDRYSPGINISFIEFHVEKQLSNNCGSEVIENFVLYLTGKRVSQGEAVMLHSKLLERYSCSC